VALEGKLNKFKFSPHLGTLLPMLVLWKPTEALVETSQSGLFFIRELAVLSVGI